MLTCLFAKFCPNQSVVAASASWIARTLRMVCHGIAHASPFGIQNTTHISIPSLAANEYQIIVTMESGKSYRSAIMSAEDFLSTLSDLRKQSNIQTIAGYSG